jgi:hypothetical protein
MKVFISWSGDYSKQLAEVIRWWLPHVLQFTKPYFTPADIEKGARWDNEISVELEQSQIGIIAMTAENRSSPWIMFEAGAISKVVEEKARVCPIIFGIKKTDLVGPLASFMATEFNRAEVRQLLTTINNAAKEWGRHVAIFAWKPCSFSQNWVATVPATWRRGVPSCLQDGLGRHRVEAAWLALRVRAQS